ncbi:MAG: outer membrane lipid asymmetry maintenance protein MlaD [Nitrospirota bacterium]
MRKFDIELAAGIFLLIGALSLGYISVKLGKLEIIGSKGYTVYAEFERAGGIKAGSTVEIAGVEVGRVKSIKLDENYQALAELQINSGVKLQDDSIASIKTKGLIGEKYIQITPGGSEQIIRDGGRIRETESAIDFEDLISKYIYGKV